jgi:HEAT repeat protein
MRWLCIGTLVVLAGTASAQSAFAQDTYQGKTVKEWTLALKSKNPQERLQALAGLSEAGADAAPAVDEMIKLFKDSYLNVRRAAVKVVSAIEHERVPAALGQALRDSDGAVRQIAAKGLCDLPNGKGQKALVEALDDKEPNVRILALAALDSMEGIGKEMLAAVGKAMKDTNLSVRRAAMLILARRAADDPDARPFLAQALRDKDKSIRGAAAQILTDAGKEVVAELVQVAKEGDATARALALQALGAVGEELKEDGLAALAKGLEDGDARVRQAALNGFGQLKGKARELGGQGVFRDIAKLMNDKEVPVRRAALVALGNIGVANADEVRKIAGGLKDSDYWVRGLAVQALGSCLAEGTAEEIVTAVLTPVTTALRDSDTRVQNAAAQILVREEKRSVPLLIPLVEKGQGKQRLWAATILGEIGAAAADAVPALQKMSKDTSLQTRQAAMAALQKIGE